MAAAPARESEDSKTYVKEMYQLDHPDRKWVEWGYLQAQHQQRNNALPPPSEWGSLPDWPAAPAQQQEWTARGGQPPPPPSVESYLSPLWQAPMDSSGGPQPFSSAPSIVHAAGSMPPGYQDVVPDWALYRGPYKERMWEGEQQGRDPNEILGLPQHTPVKTAAWYEATGENPGIFGSVYAWEGDGQVPAPENTRQVRFPRPKAQDLLRLISLKSELQRQAERAERRQEAWEENIPLFWKRRDTPQAVHPHFEGKITFWRGPARAVQRFLTIGNVMKLAQAGYRYAADQLEEEGQWMSPKHLRALRESLWRTEPQNEPVLTDLMVEVLMHSPDYQQYDTWEEVLDRMNALALDAFGKRLVDGWKEAITRRHRQAEPGNGAVRARLRQGPESTRHEFRPDYTRINETGHSVPTVMSKRW